MKQFFRGFKYAFNGLIFCIKNERNFRFDICMAAFMIYIKSFYALSSSENAIFYISIFLVLGFEALNTAIEACVDIISKEYSILGKIAKDTSAGAVLICAFSSVIVGIILFFDIGIIKEIVLYHLDNLNNLIFVALYTVMAYCFTFKIFKNNNKGIK